MSPDRRSSVDSQRRKLQRKSTLIQYMTTWVGILSLAQWLEHWFCTGTTQNRFPAKTQELFQLCLTLVIDYHVVRITPKVSDYWYDL